MAIMVKLVAWIYGKPSSRATPRTAAIASWAGCTPNARCASTTPSSALALSARPGCAGRRFVMEEMVSQRPRVIGSCRIDDSNSFGRMYGAQGHRADHSPDKAFVAVCDRGDRELTVRVIPCRDVFAERDDCERGG